MSEIDRHFHLNEGNIDDNLDNSQVHFHLDEGHIDDNLDNSQRAFSISFNQVISGESPEPIVVLGCYLQEDEKIVPQFDIDERKISPQRLVGLGRALITNSASVDAPDLGMYLDRQGIPSETKAHIERMVKKLEEGEWRVCSSVSSQGVLIGVIDQGNNALIYQFPPSLDYIQQVLNYLNNLPSS